MRCFLYICVHCNARFSDYDGGDCCECDCVSTDEFTCGDVVTGGFDCVDPNSPCVDGLVDAGTKTVVTVSTNAYDTRPGADSNDIGCNLDGCLPELARDGNNDDIESRWSCARKIVVEDDACEITFDLQDAQDIKDVQVSFWKKDIRMRKLQVGGWMVRVHSVCRSTRLVRFCCCCCWCSCW